MSGDSADDAFELTEVLVGSESDLAGRTLAECRFQQRFGCTVVGGWFHGEFVAPVDPDRTLVEHTVLLVTGKPEGLPTLGRVTAEHPCRRVVVAGYGVVGRTVTERLTAAGVDVTVVDIEERTGVDIVGDITEPATLREAGVTDADSVILALSRDSLVVYAALVISNHAPAVDVLARADDVDHVQNCYDAGATYTLGLSTVTAHMVTARVVSSSGEDNARHELLRTRTPALVGRSLGDADVRARTGVHVVAVERRGDLHSSPGSGFVVRDADTLLLAGTRTEVAEFERTYANNG